MSIFEQITKFFGFAAEKGEVAKVLPKFVHNAPVTFNVSEELGKRTVRVMSGEKDVGSLYYILDPRGKAMVRGSAVAKEYRGQGLGKALYKKAIEDARAQGAKVFTSDIELTSPSAAGVWKSLMKEGLPIEEFAWGKVGSTGNTGWRLNLQDARTVGMKNVQMQIAAKTSEDMLKAGAGHDNSTLLNRSMSGRSGSRRTSSAL
jgi:GNAT superfamily N-acetyltransferase